MTYDEIFQVIKTFYSKANHDILIGYHFRVIDNFEEHFPRIADFWNLQLNQELKDKSHLPFKLIEVHNPLPIKLGEVNRWIQLFKDSLDEEDVSEQDQELWLEKIEHFKTKMFKTLEQREGDS